MKVSAALRTHPAIIAGRLGITLGVLSTRLVLPGCFAATAEVPTAITTARQLVTLSMEEADRQLPVDLQGWLTAYDSKSTIAFLQDRTAGIFIYAPKFPPGMVFGKHVRMRGVTGSGRYTPILQLSDAELLPDEPFPQPRAISLAELQEGRADSQWVEIEGTVTSEAEDWRHWMIHIAAGRENIPVRILDFDPQHPPHLTGCHVRVRGVGGAHHDDAKSSREFLLYCQNTNLITVITQADRDPFRLPYSSLRSLSRFRGPWETELRMRVRGTVLMAWPGHFFYMRTEEGPARIESDSRTPLEPGDIVDVVGFPRPSEAVPALASSVFRILGKTNAPAISAYRVNPDKITPHLGDLITLYGRISHEQDDYPDRLELHIEAGQSMFHAYLPVRKGESHVALPEGAQVKLTGIAEVIPAREFQPELFRLWLRTRDDIELRNPVLVRIQQLGLGALPVGFVVVAGGALWVVRRRNRLVLAEREMRLRESRLADQHRRLFEDNQDMAFSLDLLGNMTRINRAGRELLEIDQQNQPIGRFTDYLQPGSDEVWRKHATLRLEGTNQPPCELVARSGSGRLITLEASAFPIMEAGKLLGFEGTARDITERVEAADALRNNQQQLRQLLEERQQMARDLHDGLIQSIYAIGLNLEESRRLAATDPAATENLLSKSVVSLNTVIRDVRNFIVGLEPQEIRGTEFRAALKSLVLTLNDARSCRFRMHIDPACDQVGSRVATQLLLMAREAMTNIIKHAGASTATVALRRHGSTLRFEVEDDGQGFDAARIPPGGRGLSNIRARAQELGGHLTIDSKPGIGTRLVFDFPTLPDPSDDPSH